MGASWGHLGIASLVGEGFGNHGRVCDESPESDEIFPLIQTRRRRIQHLFAQLTDASDSEEEFYDSDEYHNPNIKTLGTYDPRHTYKDETWSQEHSIK